ncbi:hypothetical protein GIB67_042148 [Kingdonia uniflora]|uniref:O-acyltransferase WSD1 C-terminal domain-containing protein n=1 Tax=Kingdonia uniflora TaxID=39325 RepID=A0A7J7LBU7_9MAGN|nr:hypothetical protein GIB67_042148 [Kingdonia uniflora]
MGALFSCFQRADDPSLPITFPSSQLDSTLGSDNKGLMNIVKYVPRIFSMFVDTTLDFAWSVMKSSVLVDDRTPIRSGTEGVELLPLVISTITFSLDHIKQIKAKLGGTVNDVITGTIFYGTRLYMQTAATKVHGPNKNRSTALVLLNTRIINTYKTINEMAKPDSESPWGNNFGFLHVAVPKSSTDAEKADPLEFVYKAKEIIKRKRRSLAVILTGRLLETMRKLRGPETTAQYIRSTLNNTSMTISNMIGPMERIALAEHPCTGIYFMVVGVPQSLTITMVSYMGKLRVAVGAERGFIDHKLFNSCLDKAFERIFKAALNTS